MSPDSPGTHIRLLKLKNKLADGLGWLIVGLLALFAVAIVGLFGSMVVGQGIGFWRMAAWTGQTTGTLDSVTVVHSDGYGRRGITSATHVTYTYRVGDRAYVGHRIGPEWGIKFTESNGEDLAKEFQKGQSIVVHYSPDQPEQAFLWPKVRTALVGFPAAFLFLLSFGLIRGWNWKQTARRKTVPACALTGLCAGGIALLFLAPVYIAPWIAGATLGGGALAGAAWGWWKGKPNPAEEDARPRAFRRRKA